MAFTIIAEHLHEILHGGDPPQLLMVIHGQGGTGKTRLLQAITKMFCDAGCAERLAKTALSGVAACQIGGKTLHSWGTLPAGKGMPRSDTWINRPSAVVVLGDFHQFPPVAGHNRALYSQRPTSNKCQLGRNIYTEFNTVINLSQQIRITDPVWLDILGRARIGACTSEDLSEIRRLVLTMEDCKVPDFSVAPWIRWNNRATEKHRAQSGEVLFICPAEDSTHGLPLDLQQCLTVAGMSPKDTEQLPTRLKLVKNMRVMITRNLATTANLSNGSRGSVVEIKLDVREDHIADEAITEGQVFLQYPPALVIIELDYCELPALRGLPQHQVPLTPEKCHFTIGSGPSTRVTRRQLPLTPAYAFTDFKSQGQTIEHVLVDIGRTTLLRDFDNNLFLRHPSEDLRIEESRIEGLVEETKKLFKSTHQQVFTL
ncbi:hypothetical protein P692DRAFT_20727611 [Suillus brevipes Sb2]|nr:hypothetical protein P692DRAFT_20727611 [Suillus brevipes Sb2]